MKLSRSSKSMLRDAKRRAHPTFVAALTALATSCGAAFSLAASPASAQSAFYHAPDDEIVGKAGAIIRQYRSR